MSILSKCIIVILLASDIILGIWLLVHNYTFPILQPKGIIALQERNLMFTAIFFMLLVVVPVLILAFHVATTYNERNTKAAYLPDWDSNRLQIVLWAFPTAIILILCVLNWISAHALDPHAAIAASVKPMTIQVVALRWKWLFIYPDSGIATVNYVAFPEKTPINFELTAYNTPMNSFWIPQLGGQIYAMSGMATQTHLMADSLGKYRGSAAEINGAGFSDMTFTAESLTPNDFNTWVASAKKSPQLLNLAAFDSLAKPSIGNPISYYATTQNSLYETIVTRYMAPSGKMQMHM